MATNSNSNTCTIAQYEYLISDVLGKGQESVVYKGVNTKNGEVVAIKVLS